MEFTFDSFLRAESNPALMPLIPQIVRFFGGNSPWFTRHAVSLSWSALTVAKELGHLARPPVVSPMRTPWRVTKLRL